MAELDRETSGQDLEMVAQSQLLLDCTRTPESPTATEPYGDDDVVHIVPAEKQYAGGGGHSGITGTSFNFVNSIVGAGMIGVPFALSEAGLVVGVVLLLVVGWLTDYSIRLLIKYGLKSKQMTYGGLVRYYLGTKGYVVLIITQFFFPFFAMCAYSIIVGQMYPSVFHQIGGGKAGIMENRQFVIVLFSCCLMIPVSLKSEIEGLANWSAVAIFGIIFLAFALIIGQQYLPPIIGENGTNTTIEPDKFASLTIIEPNVIQAIGIFATAYVCHHNSFLLYDGLKDATEKRFATVTHISVGASFWLMTIIGVAGYWPFGENTQANVLDNFPMDDTLINLGRVFYGITVMLTYPIECFVTREVLAEIVYTTEAEKLTRRQHVGVTLPVCLCVMVIALFVTDLGVILELNGVIFANLIAFILPALIANAAMKRDRISIFTTQRLQPLALLMFGVLVMVLGIIMIILEKVVDA
eukprot:m.42721 g.42721  ORF g.42721 m.42721 type:complete len:468 (+) comp19194_c0_seq1:229-1632(+)